MKVVVEVKEALELLKKLIVKLVFFIKEQVVKMLVVL